MACKSFSWLATSSMGVSGVSGPTRLGSVLCEPLRSGVQIIRCSDGCASIISGLLSVSSDTIDRWSKSMGWFSNLGGALPLPLLLLLHSSLLDLTMMGSSGGNGGLIITQEPPSWQHSSLQWPSSLQRHVSHESESWGETETRLDWQIWELHSLLTSLFPSQPALPLPPPLQRRPLPPLPRHPPYSCSLSFALKRLLSLSHSSRSVQISRRNFSFSRRKLLISDWPAGKANKYYILLW